MACIVKWWNMALRIYNGFLFIVCLIFSFPIGAEDNKTLYIQNIPFHVSIADDDAERETGLMFVKSLPDHHGMLFVFDDPVRTSFWMKNTLISLDMLFIDEDGIIRHMHENATPNSLRPIPSLVPVKYVLEVAGGTIAHDKIKIGNTIKSDFFP